MSKYQICAGRKRSRGETGRRTQERKKIDEEDFNAGPETELLQHADESFLSTIRAGVIDENTPPRNTQPNSGCARDLK